MTAGTWVALVATLLVAFALVTLLKRRARHTPRGREFFRHPAAAPGLVVLSFFALLAVAAPLIAPFDPIRQLDPVDLQSQPPSWTHLLGTDVYSRDTWSRLAFGARISLAVGAVAMLVAVTVGSLVGAVAG